LIFVNLFCSLFPKASKEREIVLVSELLPFPLTFILSFSLLTTYRKQQKVKRHRCLHFIESNMKFSLLHIVVMVGLLPATSLAQHSVPPHPHHPHHSSQEILAKFRHHFRCPYAAEWVTKGPHQAAIDLGIVVGAGRNNHHKQNNHTASTSATRMVRGGSSMHHHHKNRLLQANSIMSAIVGHCTFTNAWTGQPTCVEFRGQYSLEDMQSRCASEQDSNLVEGDPCSSTTNPPVGWCLVEISGTTTMEATPMVGDCQQNKMACESFMSGTFDGSCDGGGSTTEAPQQQQETEEDGKLGGGSSNSSSAGTQPPYGNTTSPDEPVTCRIAPGK
jgi:hypothetical protein